MMKTTNRQIINKQFAQLLHKQEESVFLLISACVLISIIIIRCLWE